LAGLIADARAKYGYVDLERCEYRKAREYNADDYVSLIGTHSDQSFTQVTERLFSIPTIKSHFMINPAWQVA